MPIHPWMWVIVGAVALAVVILLLLGILKKKKHPTA